MDYFADDFHKYLSKIKDYKKLILKRQLFLRHYVSDPKRHATNAAIKAGYPEKSAQSKSSQILKDVKHIVEEYDVMVAADNANLRMKIVRELCLIAFSDVTEFMEWSKRGLEFIDSKKLKEDFGKVISEIQMNDTMFGVNKKMKTHSKMQALDMLNKMHGFYTAIDVNINNPDGSLKPKITVTLPSNGREKKQK